MKGEIHTSVQYHITLNQEEAYWLRGLMYNPLNDEEEETDRDKTMRKKLWNALKEPTKSGMLVKPGTVIMT